MPVLEFWRRSHHFHDYSSLGEKFQSSPNAQSPLRSSSAKTLPMLTIPMAMLAILIQTAAMSVADLGEGPNINFLDQTEKNENNFFETGLSTYLRVWMTAPLPPPPPPYLNPGSSTACSTSLHMPPLGISICDGE